MSVEDAEAALTAAHAAWMVAVELGEVQRMKDKHRALELAEAALERARATEVTWEDVYGERDGVDFFPDPGYEPNNDPRDV